MRRLLDGLSGARGIGVFAALVLAALAGMLLMSGAYRDAPGADGAGDDMEQRLSAVLEHIEGAEGVHVMIARDDGGEAVGAVVVADRLESVRARLEVESAVQAALGIGLDRIRVIGDAGKEEIGGIVQ